MSAGEFAWFDQREDRHVSRAIDMIRVYQYKMPDGIGPLRGGPWPQDWWTAFWRRLDHTTEERATFLRTWAERQPGGYQKTLTEAFSVDHDRHPYIRRGQQTLEAFC